MSSIKVGGSVSEGWATVENWRSRVSFNHGYNGEKRLRRFMAYLDQNEPKFRGMSPDGLVDFQRQVGNGDRYVLLDALQRWVNSIPQLRAESKSGYYVSVKSFLEHNRAPLPSDKSFKIRSDVEPVRSKLDVETVKRVILASKGKYQAIFMVMLQAGLDEEGFMHWNETGLESTLKQLRDKPEGPLRIDLPGRKGSKNIETFYSFVGRDGCRLLSNYLKQRGSQPGPIFRLSKKSGKKALIKYWTRVLKRLGYIEQVSSSKANRYGYNLHRMRGVFRSRWRLSGVDVEIGEFYLGHAPDRLGYDKSPWLDPEWYEEKYSEVQSWLNILSEDPLHVPRREVTELRKKLDELEAGQDKEVETLKAQFEEARKEQISEVEDLRKQVGEMMPTFRMAQRMFGERKEWDKLRGSPPEL